MDRHPFVYILASGPRGTTYIGVTSDLPGRLWKHRNLKGSGFTGRYRVYRLVHFEAFADMESAITREKQLKRWHRSWKINLIEETNPHWNDLAVGLGFDPLPSGKRQANSPPRHAELGSASMPNRAQHSQGVGLSNMDPETSSG